MTTGWFFPALGGGEEKGLNDAGVEAFKRIHSLGRETCQNIGDARRSGSDNPAIATFDFRQVPASHFPGIKQFRKHMESCRDYVLEGSPDGAANETAFFHKALEMLGKDTIPMLRIGDRNTTGLLGLDNERQKPFFRLIRGQGNSSLQGVGGGTYGIGQRAPYAHSPFRTIIYSTKTDDGAAFVAKSILATHLHPFDGNKTQSTGWWCTRNGDSDEWTALRDGNDIPETFRRSEVGTDLWVTGFESEEWEKSIRHSVLVHFFAAIANRQLELELAEDGRVISRITAENLKDELYRAADEVIHDPNERPEDDLKTPRTTTYFYRALQSPVGGKPFTTTIPNLGEVQFYVWRDAKDSQAPERWMTMRKPRILVESFGSGLLSGFAGVLLCDNDQGNKYLALMEGPKHEEWDVDEARNWTPAEKRTGKAALNAIRAFVRETLKQIRGEHMPERQDVPFLGRYLPSQPEQEDSAPGAADELSGRPTDSETGEYITKPAQGRLAGKARRTKPPVVNKREDSQSSGGSQGAGGQEGEGGGGDHGRGGKGEGSGDSSDSEGKDTRSLSSRDVHFRAYMERDGSYVLRIRSRDQDAKVSTALLRLAAVGEERVENIEIDSAEIVGTGRTLDIQGSAIKDVEVSGATTLIKVRLKSEIPIALGLGG